MTDPIERSAAIEAVNNAVDWTAAMDALRSLPSAGGEG